MPDELVQILVVEDNPDHFRLMAKALRREFREVQLTHAGDGHSCLHYVRELEFHLIVLDYSLPGENGLQVLKQIRAIDSRVPVLMITAFGTEGVAVQAMKLGASDYIIKSDGFFTALPVTAARIIREAKEKHRLAVTEQFYKDLVENAIDGIFMLDDAGYIRMVNNSCLEICGFTKKDLLGKHFSTMIPESDFRRFARQFWGQQRYRKISGLRTKIKHASGGFVPIELSVMPVKKGNRLFGYHGILRDISKQIQAELEKQKILEELQRVNDDLQEKNRKLQELNELKSQFVSNVGHELRTPLNSILGYAELLRNGIYGDVSAEQVKAIDNILHSGNHLLNLINELLDLAKIQSGTFRIQKDYASVYDIVHAAVTTLKPSIQDKGLQLVTHLEENLPRFFVDSQKMYQVLLNILGNAVKFTSRGKIEIRAYRDGEMILLSVSDTGIGIPKEELENIFLDFHQSDGGYSRRFGGTGLGLSLAKHLVELHQGKIWVESEIGKGSIFYVQIPIHGEAVEPKTVK